MPQLVAALRVGGPGAMQGESHLQTLLGGIRPVLDPRPFGFGFLPPGSGTIRGV
jgi:hypothetical protein